MKNALGKFASISKNSTFRSHTGTSRCSSIRSTRTFSTVTQPRNHTFLTLGIAGTGLLLASSLSNQAFYDVAKSEEAAKETIKTPKTRVKGERVRKKKKKKKRKKISRITNPGKFSEEVNVHKDVLHGFRPFSGGQFHFEFPLVEEQEKIFKVNVSLLAEKSPPQGNEKQQAECGTELILGKDTVMTGKISKGTIEGRWNQNYAPRFNKKFSTSTSFYNSTRGANLNIENHMKAKDYTVSLGYGLGHIDQTHQELTLSYLQSIAPKYSLGCKCLHALNQSTNLHFLAQYKNVKGKLNDKEGNIISLYGSPNIMENRGVLSVGYTKMIKPGISLVSELTTQQLPPDHPMGKPYVSQCLAGARYSGNTFQYHCVIDSTGTIAGNLIQVSSFGAQLTFSGMLNHWAGTSNFGVGLKFAPQRPQ